MFKFQAITDKDVVLDIIFAETPVKGASVLSFLCTTLMGFVLDQYYIDN
jgi:hypothetical protein